MKATNKKKDKKDRKVMLVRALCLFLCVLMGGGSIVTLLYYILGGF